MAKMVKTTMSIERDTAEMVKKVKRKMSFDIDKDLTTDEALLRLCETYLTEHADGLVSEKGTDVKGGKDDE